MPIYLDPRVIEGSLYSLDNDIKHHFITSTMNGLEVSVLEHRLKDTIMELKNLSVEFNTFKNNLEHSLMQHFHPRQVGGRVCECPHTYFCSGGRYRPSSVGGVEHGSSFAAHCNTPFPQSLNLSGSSSSSSNTKDNSGVMAPLEEVTSGLGNSEKEGDRSEDEEDWRSTGEERGNSGGVRTNSEGSGDETWELFSLSGIRRDSV
jgi:hypothetical protein